MDTIQSPSDILAEDDRRLKTLSRRFDPVSGYNSTGSRRMLQLSDFILPQQWLPASMAGLPLVESLARCGSIAGAAAERGESVEHVASALLRQRLLHDFPFWAALTVKIKNKGGGADVRFILNRAQRRLVEAFEKMRLDRRPIRLILLKARQWGGSTCTQLYMAWLQLMHSTGLNSLIIAHQGAGSDEIKDMFDRMIEAYPLTLLYDPDELQHLRGNPGSHRKMVGVGKSGLIFKVPQRNCKIKIGTAERPDSCRGGDYNLVHLSEVGIWRATDGKSPEDIVRSACGGVLLKPLTMIVYESTANGTGNFFHGEYMAARRGESQFEPLFISWYEIDQYRLPLDPDARRALARRLWDERESEAETSRRPSGRYLYSLFEKGATLDAVNWYIAERAKYNEQSRMAAEYPTDDVEAFAHSGYRVFDPYEVERLRHDCIDPPATGMLQGDAPTGAASLNGIKFIDSHSGELQIWAFPDTSGTIADRYLAVVDVGGRGAKADWSVVAVFDRAPMTQGRGPEIVAQWRGHCDTDRLAWTAARIARYYDDALLVVESNTLETREADRMIDAGQAPYILLQIREAYPNLYARRGGNADDLRTGAGTRLGFHTNTVTKPMVIATLVHAVRDTLYTERSTEALNELLSYERRPNGSFGAIAGCHDDMLMTRAIGLHIAMYEMDMPRTRSLTGYTRRATRRRPATEACF